MKRIVLFLACFLLFTLSALSAERVWYMDSNNFKNNGNLDSTYYLPKYTYDWQNNESLGSAENGTYSKLNTIGNFGVFECDHRIEYFIETDGRFVSQSDSTKYREFYIAFRPRCLYDGGDKNYNLGSNGIDIVESDRLPNTKVTGTLDYIAPAVPQGGKVTRVNSSGLMKNVTRFHSDLILCMDELTAQDRQHLAETDDYVGEITLGWRCAEDGCQTPSHYGSFKVILRGYYGTNAPSSSRVTMYVTPDPGSTSLDISKIVRQQGGVADVAELKIYATSTQSTKWSDKLFTFISASNDYTDDTKTFALKNSRNATLIPFTVSVYQSDGSTLVKSFSGNTKYANKMTDYINLAPFQTAIPNREGNQTYSVVFEGIVKINLNLTAADLDSDTNLTYPGMYTSSIYFHIVTDGSII